MRCAVIIAVLILGISSMTKTTAFAGDWRFPIGLSYIDGQQKIVDQIEDNLVADDQIHKTVSGFTVGVSFYPYYEFENGLGLGFGFGPLGIILGVDASLSDIPLLGFVRYSLTPESNVSPYLRAGVSRHIPNGDYVEGYQIGFAGALGIELLRDKAVGMGIEVGYDTAAIELENKLTADPYDRAQIEPVGFTVSIFAVF